MIDPADKAQRETRRHELKLWLDASSSISVLNKIEDELALLDYIDRLEAERDALVQTALSEGIRTGEIERERDALRKELQDAHATYEPEIAKLKKELDFERIGLNTLTQVLDAERIRAMQYQARAENDA